MRLLYLMTEGEWSDNGEIVWSNDFGSTVELGGMPHASSRLVMYVVMSKPLFVVGSNEDMAILSFAAVKKLNACGTMIM